MDADLDRVKIIHDEVDRYMGQHKISMVEVEMAFMQLRHEWINKGRPEPNYETRDNYGQFFNRWESYRRGALGPRGHGPGGAIDGSGW